MMRTQQPEGLVGSAVSRGVNRLISLKTRVSNNVDDAVR